MRRSMTSRARIRAAGGVVVRRSSGSEPALLYWLMRSVGGEAAPHNEVDAVRWVSLARAVQLLTYQRDRDLLDRLPSS